MTMEAVAGRDIISRSTASSSPANPHHRDGRRNSRAAASLPTKTPRYDSNLVVPWSFSAEVNGRVEGDKIEVRVKHIKAGCGEGDEITAQGGLVLLKVRRWTRGEATGKGNERGCRAS